MASFLKDVDFFRRVPKDLTESSFHGFLLSIIAGLFMTILLITEFSAYMSTSTETQIIMDRSGEQQLRINFNISMLDLRCEFATLDMVDALGTNRLNVSQGVEKWELDLLGRRRKFLGLNSAQEDLLHEISVVEKHEGEQVVTLGGAEGGNTFEKHLKENEHVMVNFYAPWCVWCQRLEPVWEAFAEDAMKQEVPMSVAKVDCVESRELCMSQRIQAFPSVRYFKKGELNSEYKTTGR